MSKSKGKKSKFISIKFVVILVIITIIIMSIAYFILDSTIKNPSNNITLVVEIAVGLIIAIFLYHFTMKTEDQNTKTLGEIKRLEKDQQETIKKITRIIEQQEIQKTQREKNYLFDIDWTTNGLFNFFTNRTRVLFEKYSDHEGDTQLEYISEDVEEQFRDFFPKNSYTVLLSSLKDISKKSNDVLSPKLINRIENLVDLIESFDKSEGEWPNNFITVYSEIRSFREDYFKK